MEKFGIIIISLVIALVVRLLIQLVIPLEFLMALGPFAIVVLWIPVIAAVYLGVNLWKKSNQNKNVNLSQNQSVGKTSTINYSTEREALEAELEELKTMDEDEKEVERLKKEISLMKKKLAENYDDYEAPGYETEEEFIARENETKKKIFYIFLFSLLFFLTAILIVSALGW